MRRYTSINFLFQSVKAALDTPTKKGMLEDWKRLNFDQIQERASWICGCTWPEISRICKLFLISYLVNKEIPEIINSLQPLPKYLSFCEKVTQTHAFKQTTVDPSDCKEFILKWNFYGSLVMSELSYKSSLHFGITSISCVIISGTFQMVKMLLDEYVVHLVETKLTYPENK
jgi:hypothetical protein